MNFRIGERLGNIDHGNIQLISQFNFEIPTIYMGFAEQQCHWHYTGDFIKKVYFIIIVSKKEGMNIVRICENR